MNKQRGAHGRAVVRRGGMSKHTAEWRFIEYLAIGDGVERDAARQAKVVAACLFVEIAQDVEVDFFEALLQRRRKVLVALGQLRSVTTRRAELLHHCRR